MSYDEFKHKLFLTVREVPLHSLTVKHDELDFPVFQWVSDQKKTIDLYGNIINFDEVYNTDNTKEDFV